MTCWGFQEIPERRGVSRATLEPLPCWTPCLIPCFQRHCPAQPQPLPASPSASAATLLLTFQLQDLAKTARVRGTGVGPGLGPCTAHRDTATVFMKQSGFCSQASGLLPPWDNHSQNLSEQCTAEIQGLQGEPGKQDHRNTLSQVCVFEPLWRQHTLVSQAQWHTAGSLPPGSASVSFGLNLTPSSGSNFPSHHMSVVVLSWALVSSSDVNFGSTGGYQTLFPQQSPLMAHSRGGQQGPLRQMQPWFRQVPYTLRAGVCSHQSIAIEMPLDCVPSSFQDGLCAVRIPTVTAQTGSCSAKR